MPKKKINKLELKDAIILGMQEKKAQKIVLLDLRKLKTSMADFFIICHGTSDKQVKAISDSVDDETRKYVKEKPWHVEGLEHCDWVLMDYIDIVVHVFNGEKREFYDIENLWGDSDLTVIND